jgi:FMN phosphatase YigB (HAD superfamily)
MPPSPPKRRSFYKPRPKTYSAVLAAPDLPAAETLFVAGSSADVPSAVGVGMPVVWHNRIGWPLVLAPYPCAKREPLMARCKV